MNILIIEDEPKVADFIAKGMREAGFTVDVVYEGIQGQKKVLHGNYDLIILDAMLPELDGFQILETIRSAGIPSKVLMLTALGQTASKIIGLNLGADDYMTKPFDFDELHARIHALMRRGKYETTDELRSADLVLYKKRQRVNRAGNDIDLTNREFTLLQFLLEHKNEIVTRTMIAQHVWNLRFETGTNVIDVYIAYLRRKIDFNFDQKLLYTIRGRGYMLQDPE